MTEVAGFLLVIASLLFFCDHATIPCVVLFIHKKVRSAGFSIIEILITISIIGALTSVVLGAISGLRDKARDTKATQSMMSLKNDADLFYIDFSTYGTFNPTNSWSASIGMCPTSYANYGNTHWSMFNAKDPNLQFNEFSENIKSIIIELNESSGGGISGTRYDKTRCAVNSKSYAFAVNSVEEDDKSMCVDSSGYIGLVDGLANATTTVFTYNASTGIVSCNG